MVIANSRGAPRFYRNEGGNFNNWLSIRLVGPTGNSAAIGAWVEVRTADGRRQVREIRAGSNFVSNDPAEAHFGLGRGRSPVSVLVRWPDGARKLFEPIPRCEHILLRHPGPSRRPRDARSGARRRDW